MAGFRDRGARRHSRHYVEHSDRAKARQGVLLGRRSRGLVQHAGLLCCVTPEADCCNMRVMAHGSQTQDGIHFHQCASWQRGDPDCGPGWVGFREIFRHDGIDAWKMGHVAEKDG